VSRGFELGRNISCEDSTVSPAWANFLRLSSSASGTFLASSGSRMVVHLIGKIYWSVNRKNLSRLI